MKIKVGDIVVAFKTGEREQHAVVVSIRSDLFVTFVKYEWRDVSGTLHSFEMDERMIVLPGTTDERKEGAK